MALTTKGLLHEIGLIGLMGLMGIAAWTFALDAAAADSPDGQRLYEQLCASCHGRYGRGEGPVAGSLTMKPPDFTQPELLAGRTDAQVLDAITKRSKHTPMAVVNGIKRESMLAAIAYVRTLAVPGAHVSWVAGKDIYGSFCWYCHGEKGDGNGPLAKNVQGKSPRDFTADSFVIEGREGEVFQSITVGAAAAFHGNPVMLEWGSKLTDQQRRDVVEYLKILKANAQAAKRR